MTRAPAAACGEPQAEGSDEGRTGRWGRARPVGRGRGRIGHPRDANQAGEVKDEGRGQGRCRERLGPVTVLGEFGRCPEFGGISRAEWFAVSVLTLKPEFDLPHHPAGIGARLLTRRNPYDE
jgi:hypothetical protein